ncbi:MAG: hypothetical protein KC501_39990 [Myxococcales bacterium]|nr:hypothetical protein [Myxococcales bacterium]
MGASPLRGGIAENGYHPRSGARGITAGTNNGRQGLATLTLAAVACTPTLDDRLREVLGEQHVGPVDFGSRQDRDRVALGEALFYDKELSGNRDISCGTCHRPASRTGDDRSLSIGTGGTGVGPDRELGTGVLTVRHAPELFDRGAEGWESLLWDGRLRQGDAWPLPAGVEPPAEIQDDLLAAQVLLQVAHRDSMRGQPGDVDVDGSPNELAAIPDADLPAVWDGVMDRLLAIDEYVERFADAFPGVSRSELGLEHAAMAIAAYEIDAFTFEQSPWDLYLEGDDGALVEPAKRGALLFYGEAGCSECHAGPLLTDQGFHNMCAPQVGLGLDWGRGGYTGDDAERYQFRTPPLRNISFTGPYFHAGTHDSLEDAIRYHLDPCTELRLYDGEGLDAEARDRLWTEDSLFTEIEQTADAAALRRVDLDHDQVSDLVQFLESLSDPSVVYAIAGLAPSSVPSGRPVDR